VHKRMQVLMRRATTICLIALFASSGCSNGWPTARHPMRGANNRCTPTTSKIERADCSLTNPGSQSTGVDLDRQQGSTPNTMRVPGKGPGG
jgi:hypothetical protein